MDSASAQTPPRRIAHLDMDAFFASVELLRYPELRGLPVVVGGRHRWQPQRLADGSWRFARLRDYSGRGVVTTSTYEARALGVFSAMGMMKAARLAPDAILLPARFEAYREYSRRFKAAVAAIAPRIEDRGIDEIYIDLSGHAQGDTEALARDIQAAVREATGLSCSIGVSPNKLLSKIASELRKPGGVTVLHMHDLPGRIWPLPAARINGIGPKAAERLRGLGIVTVGELAAAAPERLQEHFGRGYAAWLLAVAHGRDERPVQTHSEPKSVSRETTFERDLHPRRDRDELSRLFTELCAQLAEDLRRKGCAARTIGIKLRFEDFRTVTRDLSLPRPVADARAIRDAAGQCLRRVELDRRLRLLGVRAAALQDAAGLGSDPASMQLSLLDP
ncbi:MAG: DNA polymerase IV [Betaproteobacteria bacterium]|nr:DNA polymerase IV [Betaproteobacteria bacterium]MBU6513723.1 DNA polymerase IV [Betaproteobacteria bacterium]MDE1956283.1 DNA polymerase IV [Betaproteobacteria bacterium]MDE2153959.1 DNA polymerase IV [Betaproteobacteria bacterium]MDE2478984.1 DNA polymerase IV [Betaproteobacteria bacterium]